MKLKNYSMVLVTLVLMSTLGLAPLLDTVSATDYVFNQTNIYNPIYDYFYLGDETVGFKSGVPSETGKISYL